jgi:hypothetical protein
MKKIMKKETSYKILQEKMDAFPEGDTSNTRNFQPVWDRLENTIHPKNKKKTIRFYFAAAVILLVIFAGFMVRYQITDKQQRQLVIQPQPDKKQLKPEPSNQPADTFAIPILPRQNPTIESSNSKKKVTIPVPNNQETGLTIQRTDAIVSIAKSSQDTPNNNFTESPATINSEVSSIATLSPKKTTLKVLHINEIDNGSTVRSTKTIKEIHANWLLTSNNVVPDIGDADNTYQPASHKKSFFAIPLQKQNSN